MINSTVLPTLIFYYPLGNTPPVSLTQDLPPEQDADILLLGCGDARNILFTCFIDSARKMDVTCCDIEPGIHARNILLYTLLIDDEASSNTERIWNIYYHWKIDESSLELLKTQTGKLLQISESVDRWHNSVYGSCIRFCDDRSLSSVKCYWSGFMSSLLPSQKEHQLSELQDAIDRAKAYRENMIGKKLNIDMTGLRALLPAINPDAVSDLTKLSNQWWDCGSILSSSTSAQKPTDLNPVFLYSPNKRLILHYNLSPLHGFPLSTAYTPVSERSAFCLENKGHPSSTERLANCATINFIQWASAFRKAVANKLVIRIFSGDALNFGLTLRNCQLTQSPSMNLFCHTCTSSPLNLHRSDYGHNNNPAPLSFDIIDTSNLADHLGPLNLIALGASLLKHHSFSCLYMETLVQCDSSLVNRLFNFFGVDVCSMSFLLGLVPPDLFTNASDSIDEDLIFHTLLKIKNIDLPPITQERSRLRWRQSRECRESNNAPFVQVEAKELTKFLIQVHDAMFKHEDPSSMFSALALNDSSAFTRERFKMSNSPYNRASFAFLLSILKGNIVSNWDECIENMYSKISRNNSIVSIQLNSVKDLILNMHIFGVDSRRFMKPTPADVRNAILAPVLPLGKGLPEQLCVTFRVRRKLFRFLTKKNPEETGCPAILCSFEGEDFRGVQRLNFFSSVQVVFGKWHAQTNEGSSNPYIEEDTAQLLGTSDMFVSVLVPTSMLLYSKPFVPLVKCAIACTLENVEFFSNELSQDLTFASSEMTSKDVFITRFMPGMSALPTFTPANNQQSKVTSAAILVHLSPDGWKINTLAKRVTLDSDAEKTKLMKKSSTVTIEFKSPLSAVVSIAKSFKLKLAFPIPLSTSKYKLRVARKSSYIEVESQLFNPLKEESAFFLFPTLLTKAPRDSVVLAPWTARHVDLDAMPQIDTRNQSAMSWLSLHLNQMFSLREMHFRNSRSKIDIRTRLKDMLYSFFMKYTESQTRQTLVFGLSTKKGIQTIIFPSCLRFDLASYTVVLDCALIPLSKALSSGRGEDQFFQDLMECSVSGLFYQVQVSEALSCAWKTMMPALIERCRTWKHTPQCEYLQAGDVPLPRGLINDGAQAICSCGIGKFPTGEYLRDPSGTFSNLGYILKRHATRVAISPIFAIPHVEDCITKDVTFGASSSTPRLQSQGKCNKCGRDSRKNAQHGQQSLFTCSKCKIVKYCSKDCQKSDWKQHKPLCKAIKDGMALLQEA